LSKMFGVNRVTVRRALRFLESQGLLSRRQGAGTYITEPKIERHADRLVPFTHGMQRRGFKPGARVINVTSDAGVEPYAGWGGYGSSKAALEQLSAILAAENPALRVYWIDPGDMRTQMQQEAFPGEDISDRLPPEASVPGFLRLIEGDLPSGRYSARTIGEPEKASHGIDGDVS